MSLPVDRTQTKKTFNLATTAPKQCGEIFDSDANLVDHRRASLGCTRKTVSSRDGVTFEQEKELKSRKRVKQDETEEEKWIRAFLVLFPNDEPQACPSPCESVKHRPVLVANIR